MRQHNIEESRGPQSPIEVHVQSATNIDRGWCTKCHNYHIKIILCISCILYSNIYAFLAELSHGMIVIQDKQRARYLLVHKKCSLHASFRRLEIISGILTEKFWQAYRTNNKRTISMRQLSSACCLWVHNFNSGCFASKPFQPLVVMPPLEQIRVLSALLRWFQHFEFFYWLKQLFFNDDMMIVCTIWLV